jgi:dipeptidyl aminopeptidase/acylaminoacyl peptidase
MMTVVTADEASNHVRAFEAGVDQLVANGLVDPDRVGIIGFSRTCYHVESALIDDPSRFAAAAIADGVDESYLQALLVPSLIHEGEAIYGGKPVGEGLRQQWLQRAPGFHLDRVETPLLIQAIAPMSILGEFEIYASLVAQGKPVDLVYFPNGQHILQKPLERMASQQGNVDWFRFWLQDYEDPDPAKAAQYQRWEKLCDMQVAENPNLPTYCVRTKH